MRLKKSVLIPDGESPFAFHVITCLAQADGIDLHVISRKTNVMCKYSRTKKSFHVLPAGWKYFEYIVEFCSNVHVDLIMPVDMDAILFFAERKKIIKDFTELNLLDDGEKLRNISDKGLLANFLIKNHLPHPRSITTLAEFRETIQGFHMPALVKPRNAGNGEGITKYTERADLIHLVQVAPQFFDAYLIQEYVNGYDIDCSVLCKDGIILAYTIQKALFANERLYQPASAIEFVHDAGVLEIAANLMESLRWTGVAHIDMRRRASDSRVEIIEINPRFWGSLQGSLHAGVNFPYLSLLATQNQSFPLPKYHDVKYMSGLSVLKRLRRNLPVTHLIRETNLLPTLKDPLPKLLKLIGYVE